MFGGRISEHRNWQHRRGNGRSKFGNIGRILVGGIFAGRSRARGLAGILELTMLSLFVWRELGLLGIGVVLVLDVSGLVNLGLRNEAL